MKEWGNKKEHKKEYDKQYYLKNKQKLLEMGRERTKKIKKKVFDAYGNKCVCCGETTFEFLSIDHINKDGYKHRKELEGNSIYRWLIKNNFPKDRFQILCFNCNLARGFYGECPHKRLKNE